MRIGGARGTWADLVSFLYDFYRADYLHKITNLVVRPISDTNRNEIQITSLSIEAMILPTAAHTDQLNDGTSDRLALDDLSAYRNLIAGRNFFAEFVPLQLNAIASRRIVLGNSLTIQPNVSRDARTQAMTFSLDENAPAGMTVDPATGVINWQPTEVHAGARIDEETGAIVWETPQEESSQQHPVTLSVSDLTGLTASRAFTVTVLGAEPPQPVQTVQGPPNFREAQLRHTIFTAYQEWENGERLVWLHDRTLPPSRSVQVLRENDTFEVGANLRATVKSISRTEVVVTFFPDPDTLYRIKIGDSLQEFAVIAPQSDGAN
jgi:hypothetical protein